MPVAHGPYDEHRDRPAEKRQIRRDGLLRVHDAKERRRISCTFWNVRKQNPGRSQATGKTAGSRNQGWPLCRGDKRQRTKIEQSVSSTLSNHARTLQIRFSKWST